MLRQLTVAELGKKIGFKTILSDIHFAIEVGELVVITGPNGAGKTTLLRILAGLTSETSGEVFWDQELFTPKKVELLRQIGMLGHRPMVYDSMTALENLMFFGKMYGVKGSKVRIEEMLRWVGLHYYKHEKVENFSRGMQQRLALARMLIHAPSLLLYDEPFTGLDEEGQRLLTGTLQMMQEEGRVQILITHNLDELNGLKYRELKLEGGQLVHAVTHELAAATVVEEAASLPMFARRASGAFGGAARGEVARAEAAGGAAEASGEVQGAPISTRVAAEAWRLASERAETLSDEDLTDDETGRSSTGLIASLNCRFKGVFAYVKGAFATSSPKEDGLPEGGITVEEFLKNQDTDDNQSETVQETRTVQKIDTGRSTDDTGHMPRLHENVILTNRYKVQKKGSSHEQNQDRRGKRNNLKIRDHAREKRGKS